MPRFEYAKICDAIDGAVSIKEVIFKLGLNVNPGNYRAIHKYAREHNLELPTTGRSESGNAATFRNTTPHDEWFVEGVLRNGRSSRKKLLILGRKYQCELCGNDGEHNGMSLILQIDHIDGDKFNNTMENLRFLCPNCHSQTPTFGNRKSHKRYSYCEDCGDRINKKSVRCRSCAQKIAVRDDCKPRPTRIEWPPVEQVAETVRRIGYSACGRELGVSDNAIRKYLTRSQAEV